MITDALDRSPTLSRNLAVELQNFEQIARFLNPSPVAIPRLPGVDIHGFSAPLRHGIGGDHILYVDFNKRFDLDARIRDAVAAGGPGVARELEHCRERAGILVADASGDRMTDALLAAMLHQSFLLGAYYELEMFGQITTKIFEHINERFHRTSSIDKYFTMIYGEISTRGRFRFISAGHHLPAVFSPESGLLMPVGEGRKVPSIPVGMQGRGKQYEVDEVDLTAGDILVLYTDGFSEHCGGTYFPDEPERLLATHKDETAEEICGRLLQSMLERAPQQDDVSVVVVKYTP